MTDRESIMTVLGAIDDPEMPITIVDLGIVEDVRIQEPSPQPSPEGRGSLALTPTLSQGRGSLALTPTLSQGRGSG